MAERNEEAGAGRSGRVEGYGAVYGLIMECEEVKSDLQGVITSAGPRIWVCTTPFSDAVGRYVGDGEEVPEEVKTFETMRDAIQFAKQWKGKPYYFKPNGTFEIVKLISYYKIAGYQRVAA